MADLNEDQRQLVGARPGPSATRLLPTPVTISGVSFISTLWLLATFLVICALVVSGAFPNWMKNHEPRELDNQLGEADIGLYQICYRIGSRSNSRICKFFLDFSPNETTTGLEDAELNDIAFIFSSSIIYAVAVWVMIVSLVTGVVAYCKPRVKNQSMFLVAFILQMIGGKDDYAAMITPHLSYTPHQILCPCVWTNMGGVLLYSG